MKRNLKNKGFLSVEMLVAFSIIAVSVLAATTVAQKAIQVSTQTLHMTQAADLLEEGAEIVHVVRDTSYVDSSGNQRASWINWDNPFSWVMSGGNCADITAGQQFCCPTNDNVYGAWQWWASYISNPDFCQFGIFTRTFSVENVYRDNNGNISLSSSGTTYDRFTKLITITVSWLEGTQTKSKTLQLYITDILNL